MENQILTILKEHKEQIITGTSIAEKLNITRSYVSKVISNLKKYGYDIEIVDRMGYIYHNDLKVIDYDKIINNLNEKERFDIVVFDKVNSTITYLKDHYKKECNKIQIAIADEQTNGIGRMSRPFVSYKGKGIYMSFLYKPTFSMETSKKITACVSVGVARAIDKLCKTNVLIKWVNDLYLNERKICGILTTGITNLELGILDYVIVGIGVNLYHQVFPSELQNIATSIFDETNILVDRSLLISEIINETIKLLDEIETNNFIKEYRLRQIAIGRMVELSTFSDTEIVKVIDVDNDGELVVEKDGKIKKVYTGEIKRMRLKYE